MGNAKPYQNADDSRKGIVNEGDVTRPLEVGCRLPVGPRHNRILELMQFLMMRSMMSGSHPFIQSACRDDPLGWDASISEDKYHVSDGPVDVVTSNANLYEISGIATGWVSGHRPVPVWGASARMG